MSGGVLLLAVLLGLVLLLGLGLVLKGFFEDLAAEVFFNPLGAGFAVIVIVVLLIVALYFWTNL
ncbi:hypothetical protein MYX82_05590 [Acidobacteria bacterium AH-259-D05]|nr:hypothetical protein [Acidobacteria bacterium AH-259-D05]